jgi:glycyl-tRNA synthetase
VRRENLTIRKHELDELSHYAKDPRGTGTVDIEYAYPFMDKPGELEGIANRVDHDLTEHTKYSGQKLSYFDPTLTNTSCPFVIEPAAGLGRATLVFMIDAYREEEVKPGDTRVVLKLHHKLAPIKVAVLPLLKKRDDIVGVANNSRATLKKKPLPRTTTRQASANCIAVRTKSARRSASQSMWTQVEKDNAVTVRDRDTMQQERVSLDQVQNYLLDKLA